MGCVSGAVGTGRWKAAGAGRRIVAGRERTTVPGVKGRPARSNLVHAQHDNPVGVRRDDGRWADREEGATPQRVQEDPRSERRRSKGDRKPGTAYRPLRRMVA